MKTNVLKATKIGVGLAIASILVACGGGGSGAVGSDNLGSAVFDLAIASEPTVYLQPGFTTTLFASAKTSDAPLKTLAWSMTNSAGTPALGLANGNCAAGSKLTNQKSSAWDCLLSITAPITASAPTTYTVLFTATDTLNNTRTLTRNVVVNFDPAYTPPPPTIGVLTMPAFSVLTGATAPLSCPAATGTTLSWFVTANGGLPITLASYSTAQTTFVAPTVTTPTNVTISCTTVDSAKAISTGSVVVTVLPPATPVPTSVTVTPAQSILANAVGTVKVTINGVSAPLYYEWSVVGTPSPSVTLAGANTDTVSFVAPTVGAATTYTFLVKYGLQPITTSYQGIGQAQGVVVVRP